LISYPPNHSLEPDHILKSPILLAIKQELQPWLWEKLNYVLDYYDHGSEYGYLGSRFEGPKARVPMMQQAFAKANAYPQRPPYPLPSSPSVDKLRDILASAPTASSERGASAPKGLKLKYTNSPEYEEWFEWDDELLTNVCLALVAVIRQHGLGDDGWSTIRWEVYDKVRLSVALSAKKQDNSRLPVRRVYERRN